MARASIHPEIKALLDLPPTSSCRVQFRGRNNDGEVVCVADHSFTVAGDTTKKFVLVCDISFETPTGG